MFKPIRANDGEPKTVLKKIAEFLKDENFVKYNKQGFTLVLHKYDEILQDANDLVKPFNGKVIINDAYVNKIMAPVFKNMFEFLAKT